MVEKVVAEKKKAVSLLIAGIGGYGFYYVKSLLEDFRHRKIRIAGVVDPFAKQSHYYLELKSRKIPFFDTIEEFYENGNYAELAVISSPIHFHVPQAITALKHGSNVLLEKPAAAAVQDIDRLISVEKESGKWVMVGYQWSYSDSIRALMRDIGNGIFGEPIRFKTLCFWPRSNEYYHRNNWAGKIAAADGSWILDSPAGNAMAHFLHNMLFISGSHESPNSPACVEAELYRANPIENYDTGICRIDLKSGTELLFYGSHATASGKGPMFNLEFDNATVSYGESSDEIIAIDNNGIRRSYGSPDREHQFRKLFEAAGAAGKQVQIDPAEIDQNDVNQNDTNRNEIVCGLKQSRPQVLCMNGMQESMRQIVDFPADLIKFDDSDKRYYVRNLDIELYNCYKQNKLPNEAGLDWAGKGKTVDLRNYTFFPNGMTRV